MKHRLWILLITLLSPPVPAVVETYEFDSEADRERYHQFVDELRCPKCQNQNLAGSNAPIAEDLRGELHRLLEEGRSDEEIVNFMVDRYGDFVLYRPRFNAETAVLWLAPAGFLLAGLAVVVAIYRRQRQPERVAEDDAPLPLSDDEQERLRRLLAQADSDEDPRDA